jgi:Biopolymer transport protein ExbD/TolR
MQDPTDAQSDGKLDLVPMIDCVMLLLLFFILTTRFVSEEKQISALLPPHGQAITQDKTPIPTPPPEIHLVLSPADLPIGLDEHGYQRAWENIQRLRGTSAQTAQLRIGGSDPITMEGRLMQGADHALAQSIIDGIHAHVDRELSAREQPGGRKEQAPVNIHCFSGLSWGYALVAYDAVRAYEGKYQPAGETPSSIMDDQQRTVTFAPPRIRNLNDHELGQELWDLKHLQ